MIQLDTVGDKVLATYYAWGTTQLPSGEKVALKIEGIPESEGKYVTSKSILFGISPEIKQLPALTATILGSPYKYSDQTSSLTLDNTEAATYINSIDVASGAIERVSLKFVSNDNRLNIAITWPSSFTSGLTIYDTSNPYQYVRVETSFFGKSLDPAFKS